MTWAVGGQTEVGETPRPLTSDRPACRETLLIKPLASNKGPVYIGDASAPASAGYPIQPGRELAITPQGPTTLQRKPWEIYVSGTEGDRVAWLANHG
jgi:hypothetical protein